MCDGSPTPSADRPSVRDLLLGGSFCYAAEVVTTRGFTPPEQPDRIKELAEALLADPRIGYISVTDSPGGVPMLPADWLGNLVSSERRRVVLHLTCKDMNRNGLEATCWRYAATGFDNVLALTGDYPTGGFSGTARPVFDLDSLGLIHLMRSMKEGLTISDRRGARRSCRRPISSSVAPSPPSSSGNPNWCRSISSCSASCATGLAG